MSPESILRDLLSAQTTSTPKMNTLLESSLSLDGIEPEIPTPDLSENFDAYLRQSWGNSTATTTEHDE